MQKFSQSLTLMGHIRSLEPEKSTFCLQCVTGDVFVVHLSAQTTLRPLYGSHSDPSDLYNSLSKGQLIGVQGIYQIHKDKKRFDARLLYTCGEGKHHFCFEESDWWLNQFKMLIDQKLVSMSSSEERYSFECSEIAHTIYGFSSAYLLTGNDSYRKAAASCVITQRDSFRTLSSDGKCCFWAHASQQGIFGRKKIPSVQGSYSLVQQIEALTGLSLYYRITLDPEVLEDIRRTIQTFYKYFLDRGRQNDPAYRGLGGFFSHIDSVSLRPDRNAHISDNMKKSFDAQFHHIPSYLIQVILALDPLTEERVDIKELLTTCHSMLHETTRLLLDQFLSDPSRGLSQNFTHDWQENSPDSPLNVGQNFKFAATLARIGNRMNSLAMRNETKEEALELQTFADRCFCAAERLTESMMERGLDPMRGGAFHLLNRDPSLYPLIDFVGMNHKEASDQIDAILACLLLHGQKGEDKSPFLDAARRLEAFWNFFFIDPSHHGLHSSVTDNGIAIAQKNRTTSLSHPYELYFFAHLYNHLFVTAAQNKKPESSFCLYFRPLQRPSALSLNIAPDFLPKNSLKIKRITINGIPKRQFNPFDFTLSLQKKELGRTIAVEYETIQSSALEIPEKPFKEKPPLSLIGKKIGVLLDHLYLPEEIDAYRRGFSRMGAEVHFISRLLGKESVLLESRRGPQHTLEVDCDVSCVDLTQYAALISSSNFASPRLRTYPNAAGPKEAKAVKFFAQAMGDKKVLKAALGHGLWILTPCLEKLRGRRIICDELLLSQLMPAGVLYTPSSKGIVIDDDLITGYSLKELPRFIQTIARGIALRDKKSKDEAVRDFFSTSEAV